MNTNDQFTIWTEEAAKLGREAGLAAASWVTDGNTSQEHYVRLAQMMDDGDPALDEYLTLPNLSGEWADGPTPVSLFEKVTGMDHAEAERDAGMGYETLVGSVMDAICEAWELASGEAFSHECERLVREAIA